MKYINFDESREYDLTLIGRVTIDLILRTIIKVYPNAKPL